MARFLFTMLFANDLGLPTRLIPIARELAGRGHSVAFLNPAPAPAQLIADSGLEAVPCPPLPQPAIAVSTRMWDVDCLFAYIGFLDEAYTREMTQIHVDTIRTFNPDIVVDSFSPFACLAARTCGKPLVTVLQGDFHPASRGFIWWEGERPSDLPDAAPIFNRVAAGFGQPPVTRIIDSFTGDLMLVVGTPETDPLPSSAGATYVGPIVWQRSNDTLPESVINLGRDRPLVWLYPGNPRYAPSPTMADSEVIIRTAIAALGDERIRVVMTSGYQPVPNGIGALPANFMLAPYLPAIAMAKRSDLMIHHGGHGSFMTGLSAGTPQVIVPTFSERESNARRMAALGVGEFVIPTVCECGEKHLDVDEFRAVVKSVLGDPEYQERATTLTGSMRKYGGAREAADRIERFDASRA
jgi:UDP:flavonoid glycosyltransferase YjiC (YdhE family)